MTTALTSIAVIIAITAGFCYAAVAVTRRAQMARAARFDSREVLSIADWCRRHVRNFSEPSVARCLARVSSITGVEAGRLRPDDRFDVELKLPHGYFIAGEWDDIEDDVARALLASKHPRTVCTVRDYIEVVAAPNTPQLSPENTAPARDE
jgi:hypothetical protein